MTYHFHLESQLVLMQICAGTHSKYINSRTVSILSHLQSRLKTELCLVLTVY